MILSTEGLAVKPFLPRCSSKYLPTRGTLWDSHTVELCCVDLGLVLWLPPL